MKIGDKVRFLNDVGGGVVSGFQGKDMVLVQDEDGFDIPVLIKECVVIETDNYNIARPQNNSKTEASAEVKHLQKMATISEEIPEPCEQEITFRPRALERRGADVLNLYIAFLPTNIKAPTSTDFEVYLVNDSNYYMHFVWMNVENASSTLRHEGVVEPNTKIFLEDLKRSALPELEKIAVQAFAYKVDKPFRAKEPVNVTLRPDLTKFYKLHTFTANEFFDQPTYLLPLIKDDNAVRSVFVSAEQIKEAMMPGIDKKAEQAASPKAKVEKKMKADDIVEVDLHIDEILESTAGMSAKDILDYQLKVFSDTMEKYKNDKGRRIVFIHGKGEGVLRNALLQELKSKYRRCTYQDASFREYGFGATMVKMKG